MRRKILALLRKAQDRDYEIPAEVAARLRADHLITDEGNLWDCLRDVVRAAVTGTSPADVAVRPLEDVLAPPSAPRTDGGRTPMSSEETPTPGTEETTASPPSEQDIKELVKRLTGWLGPERRLACSR